MYRKRGGECQVKQRKTSDFQDSCRAVIIDELPSALSSYISALSRSQHFHDCCTERYE